METYPFSSSNISTSQTFSNVERFVKSTYLVRGAAADIWLIEQQAGTSAHPQKYISKTLRVGPKCFRGRHRDLMRKNRQCRSDDEFPKEFIQHFRLIVDQWSNIQHKNIVQIFGLDRKANLRVEFCTNGNARQHLESCNQGFTSKNLMIFEIMKGVEYLHTMKPPIIHGSLSMDKIFVSQNEITKIGEFGLSALTRDFSLLAPSISHAGLSRWMSPELVDSDPNKDVPKPTIASDVWALGCTLFEIIEGELPYSKHKQESQVRTEIAQGKHPGHRSSDEFSHVWSILESCWQASPNLRPSASTIRKSAYPRDIFPTMFTRRPWRHFSWPRLTQTNGILSYVNNWHKNQFHQQDPYFRCTKVLGRKDNDPIWEAVAIVFGELQPQFTGMGYSIRLAKRDLAQKLARSGHC